MFRDKGLLFEQMANPLWFEKDPKLAWAFYGHRLHLYRNTKPHLGYTLLWDFAQTLPGGAFVFTSNVDGHFSMAGFAEEQIMEIHGSIHYMQCTLPCSTKIWQGAQTNIEVDLASFQAHHPLPVCPHYGRISRPNILMFDDSGYISHRTFIHQKLMNQWFSDIRELHLTIIEIGAGNAVPTVRYTVERIARERNSTLIRINVRDYEVPKGGIALTLTGLEALQRILKI